MAQELNLPQLTTKNYKVVKEIGTGSFGVVYLVQLAEKSVYQVVKKISLQNLTSKQQKRAAEEVQILRKLQHPHIIQFHQAFLEQQSLCIMMEYAEQGDLNKFIQNQKLKGKYVCEKDIWEISYQTLLGVQYLHQNRIVHRDLKCANLLLNKDKILKIADLGVSKTLDDKPSYAGTPMYQAPEQIKRKQYDFRSDMWQVGCAIYQLACLVPPYQSDNINVLNHQIVYKKYKPIPHFFSVRLANFIEQLLQKSPERRPTVEQAIAIIPQHVRRNYKLKQYTAQQDLKQAHLLTPLTQISSTVETDQATVKRNFHKRAQSQIEQTLIKIEPQQKDSVEKLKNIVNKRSQMNLQLKREIAPATIKQIMPQSNTVKIVRNSMQLDEQIKPQSFVQNFLLRGFSRHNDRPQTAAVKRNLILSQYQENFPLSFQEKTVKRVKKLTINDLR